MRNRNTLLSRAVPRSSQQQHDPYLLQNQPQDTTHDSYEVHTSTPPTHLHAYPHPIPAIRLVQATPSPDTSAAFNASADTSTPEPSVLLPNPHSSPRKKLVPKKSKLALFTSSREKDKDISDVIRRVNARAENEGGDAICNVTVNGGTIKWGDKIKKGGKNDKKKGGGGGSARSTIDICIDPAHDPDIGEIVVVKKKKSRATLNGIRWALGEATNTNVGGEPKEPESKVEENLKAKGKVEEKEKWWSIGRGWKDKDKDKGGKAPRTRNHSLDSSLLLSVPSSTSAASARSVPVTFTTLSSSLASGTGSTRSVPITTAGAPSASHVTPFLTISGPDCFSANPDTQSHLPYDSTPLQFDYTARSQSKLNLTGKSKSKSKFQRPRFGSTPGLLGVKSASTSGLLSTDLSILGPTSTSSLKTGLSTSSSLKPVASSNSGFSTGLLTPPDSAVSSGFTSPGNGHLTVPSAHEHVHTFAPSNSGTNANLNANTNASNTGSLALRAMKSLARIGSWAQLRNGSGSDNAIDGSGAKESKKEDGGKAKKKKSTKAELKDKDKERALLGLGQAPRVSIKSSSSSWEVGALSIGDDMTGMSRIGGNGVESRVSSGNTFSSTLSSGKRLSSESSTNRLSSVSASSTNRLSSTYSTASSRNRLSSGSGSAFASGEDTNTLDLARGVSRGRGGRGSVRWGGVYVAGEGDERERDGEVGAMKEKRSKKERKEKEKRGKSSRRSLEGRRRATVMGVFLEAGAGEGGQREERDGRKMENRDDDGDEEEGDGDGEGEEACVRIGVAVRVPVGLGVGPDGDGEANQRQSQPQPRIRVRPVSEQLLGSSSMNVNRDPGVRPRPREQSQGATARERPRGIMGMGSLDVGCEEALTLLEAANSDLASLINRLDLEATPTTSTRRGSPGCGRLVREGSGVFGKEYSIPFTTQPYRAAFRIPSFADSDDGFGGGFDESPLKKMARGGASITSLRGYNNASMSKSQEAKQDSEGMERPQADIAVTIRQSKPASTSNMIGQPILPWAVLQQSVEANYKMNQPGSKLPSMTATWVPPTGVPFIGDQNSLQPLQPLQPPRYRRATVAPYPNTAATVNGNGIIDSAKIPDMSSATNSDLIHAAPRIRTSSSNLRSRAAPFMRVSSPMRTLSESRVSKDFGSASASVSVSRASSISSTFGSSFVKNQNSTLAVNLDSNTHANALKAQTPSPLGNPAPSSHTFGVRPRYVLPPVESHSSLRSATGSGADETPTRPGHIRKGSSLVPFVKRAVESYEAKVMEEKKRISSGSPSPKLASKVKPRTKKPMLGEERTLLTDDDNTLNAEARRELGFKGTLGVVDNEECHDDEDPDSDIPDELQVILSLSDDTRESFGGKTREGEFPVDAVEDTLSFVSPPPTSLSRLPPSPGLPPSAPLPTPTSTSGLVEPSMKPSPPAPSFLPYFEPSPTPSLTGPPSTLTAPSSQPQQKSTVLPTFAVTVQPVSDDGANEADVDEPNTGSSSDSDDTKESFDFTGELQRLNESGGAHRRSFVEQLEEAFKTPSKLGGEALGFELEGLLGAGKNTHVDDDNSRALNDYAAQNHEISMMVASLDKSMNLLRPQASVASKPSYGRLDTAFKFGGKPREEMDPATWDNSIARELPGVAALSTSPSPAPGLPSRRSRASSTSIIEEDSSVLRSIYAHAAQHLELGTHRAQASLSLESDTSSKRRARQVHVPAHARSSSDASFSGMSSFGAVRTKFEYGAERPTYYDTSFQLPASRAHARQESMFSIASISSYGEVINNGSNDPFNYGEDVLEERDGLASIDQVMSSFSDKQRRKRFSTDSDLSSFYFRSRREHARNQSVVSTTSMNGPPISLYNRSFGHKRSDSAGSASSIAAAYGAHGASGGRAAWIRHKQGTSIDSVGSDFSAARLGRPGVGDKMFESAVDHEPLTSISASPPESISGELAQKTSYDSILDEDRRSTIDSIFDHTGQRSSMSSDSVFGYDNEPNRGNLFPPAHYRPLSIISIGNPGTPREDDTMITMLGGGHVRRRSIGSSFEQSPCFRVEKREKRKHLDFHPYGYDGSPTKNRLAHRLSVASSTSSKSTKSKFGEARMALAQKGLLHRDSLEDSCLSAEGEEDCTMQSIRLPVFDRPPPSSRSRGRPVVTVSQPPDTTPPLSSSEGSGESQSSIDIGHLKALLATASAGSRSSNSRVRARGQGHRRRASQMSRGSAIGTIQEENPGLSNSPSPNARTNRNSFESTSSFPPSPCDPAPESQPNVEVVEWDDESMVMGLRKYYALRNEADETITHSRIVWPDTPFSLHALQTFDPPKHPDGMQALLEHSQKSYAPLPSDLHPRRVRSRTSSFNRPSPYPRNIHRSLSPSTNSTKSRRSSIDMSSSFDKSRALRNVPVSTNTVSPPPTLADFAPFSPLILDASQSDENIKPQAPLSVIKPAVRPRVGSAARRNALGWTKRKTPKAKEGKSINPNKENEAHGLLISPTESLRIVRPRPRGRVAPTPRSTSILV